MGLALTGWASLPLVQRQMAIPASFLLGLIVAIAPTWLFRRRLAAHGWIVALMAAASLVLSRVAFLRTPIPLGRSSIDETGSLIASYNNAMTVCQAVLLCGAALFVIFRRRDRENAHGSA
jgi:hypothetical protein